MGTNVNEFSATEEITISTFPMSHCYHCFAWGFKETHIFILSRELLCKLDSNWRVGVLLETEKTKIDMLFQTATTVAGCWSRTSATQVNLSDSRSHLNEWRKVSSTENGTSRWTESIFRDFLTWVIEHASVNFIFFEQIRIY